MFLYSQKKLCPGIVTTTSAPDKSVFGNVCNRNGRVMYFCVPNAATNLIFVYSGVTEFTQFMETTCGFCSIWNSSTDPADPPDPPDQVSGAAARDLPSINAGCQDDASSKQTPSN